MKWKILILALFGAVMLTGCCSKCRKYQKLRKPLVGTEWQLVQIDGKSVTTSDREDNQSYSVVFGEDGNIAGMGSCNRFMGSWESTPNRDLKITIAGSTYRLCRNREMETKFLEMFSRVTHYDMDGPMLMLLSDGYLVALFEGRE